MSVHVSEIRAKDVLGNRFTTVRYCGKCDIYVPEGANCPLCGGKPQFKISTLVKMRMIGWKFVVCLAFFAAALISDLLFRGEISPTSPLMIISAVFFALQILTTAIGFQGLYINSLVSFLTKHDRMIKNSFGTEMLIDKYDADGIYPVAEKQKRPVAIGKTNALSAYIELKRIAAALDCPRCKALRAHALMQMEWDDVGLYEVNSLCSREYNGTVVRYLYRLLSTNANYITSDAVLYVLCYADEIRGGLNDGREIVAAFARHARDTFPDLLRKE